MRVFQSALVAMCFFSGLTIAKENSDTVVQFVDAFNAKDLDGMLAVVNKDMRWMSVTGHTITTETSSIEELRQAMESYFKSVPSAKSHVHHLHQSGNFVYALEQASWQSKDQLKSQCSMAVYEFSATRIKHVWYFPAHQC